MIAAATAMSNVGRPGRNWRKFAVVISALLALAVLGTLLVRSFLISTPVSSGAGYWVLPQRRVVETTVSASGTVKLKTGAEVRVGAQISGIVEKLNVSIGSRVRQNDVIAQIDSRSIAAAIAQAQAQLAHDEVALAKARLDDSRMQRLLSAQAIAAQQADDARATLLLAEATVASSQRALETARVALNYVTIRAPITGTVASVATQQGETVAAAFAAPTFVTIIADDALEVVAMVDEADIGSVRVGEPAIFTTETYPDRDFAGHVVRIAPVATLVSGVVNYEVGIAIDGAMTDLKPDMTTNVTIRTASHQGLFVPASAVQRSSDGAFAILRGPRGAPIRRRVEIMGRKAGTLEIVRGLAANDFVLVGGTP
jgi:macrolide-specific efflux system membrane fusion protein